jgi:diguanylate cyclase (GGDEF)-like protein
MKMKNKILLIIFTFLISVLIVLFSLYYLVQKSTAHSLVTQQLTHKTQERVSFFNEVIKHETGILKAIAKDRELLLFAKTNKHKEEVESLFVTIEHTEDDIYDIRFIAKDGREIIRVNNYKEPYVVEQKNLQNKKNRYYFKGAMKKAKGEVYYSNIDLNFEHGVVQKSKIPTIRIASPIVIDGDKKGIVVMSVSMKEYLEDMQKAVFHDINLIYGDGSIIVSRGSKFNLDKNYKIKTNIIDIYPFIPKNFTKFDNLETDDFSLQLLSIDSPKKIYIVLVPKKFKKYSEFEDKIDKMFAILVFIILFLFPLGYLFSRYIEKLYMEKIDMKEQIYIDELTKVYNRKAYNEKIQENINTYTRYNSKFCVALYDVDDFKSVNDTYGHINGDRVLQIMSKKIKKNIRKTDAIFRVGGEEFIIIFAQTKLEDAYRISQKLRLLIASSEIIKGRKITISMGISEFGKYDDIDTIYKRVDKLLYQAKNSGKNRISFI